MLQSAHKLHNNSIFMHMNSLVRCGFMAILLCTAMLCGCAKVYMPPVQVEGVHPDYGERLRVLTKQYVVIDDNVTLVDDVQQSDRTLQLQLVRDTAGVVVVFEMRESKDGSLIWAYRHIAYDPNEFIPIVSRVSKEKIR